MLTPAKRQPLKTPMDAEGFRALADRYRHMARVAQRGDIRQQLRQGVDDFEAKAEAAGKTQRFRQTEMVGDQ